MGSGYPSDPQWENPQRGKWPWAPLEEDRQGSWQRWGGLDSLLGARVPGFLFPGRNWCHVGRLEVSEGMLRPQFQGWVPEGKIDMPWAWSRKERTEQEGGEQCPHWQCPSGLGKKDADSRTRKGDAGPGPAGLPLPAGGEAGGSARRESGQEIMPSGGLAATEQSHWKVLDMGGPLGRQLEELDVTPLDSVDGHWGDRGRTG